MSSSGFLALASFGFMFTGVVRGKAAAVWFGAQGLGAFSQANLVQTLLITLCGGGLVTGGKVLLSRPGLLEDERRQRLAWVLWVPLTVSGTAALCTALFAEPIASAVFGDPKYGSLLSITVMGLPAAVGAQVALGAAQAFGERAKLVAASAASALMGGAVVVVLMSSGEIASAAWTLVAAPVVQFACVLMICPSVRRRLWARPAMPRSELRALTTLAGASLLLGLAAITGENIARSMVISQRGLESIGRFQPAALLSTQAFSIILSAIATSVLVEVNRNANVPEALGKLLTDTGVDLVIIVAVAALWVACLVDVLIPLFYQSNLISSASLVVVMLAGEPMRCAAWVAGAALLPMRMHRTWLAVGLAVVLIQSGSAAWLAHLIGVWALPAGYLAGAMLSQVVTLVALRQHGVAIRWKLCGVSVGAAALIIGGNAFGQAVPWHLDLPGSILALVTVPAVFLYGRRSPGPLRGIVERAQRAAWRTPNA